MNKRNVVIGTIAAGALAVGGLMYSLSGPSPVPVGGDLQAALNAASCGDVVTVEAGGVYAANLTLSKICDTPITIQSTRASELPEGVRVTPAQLALMARFQSVVNAEPVVKTTAGAKGYKFIGIEFTTDSPTRYVYDMVRLGEGRDVQKTLASVPRNLTIDRSYIHGWSTQDVQRGVSMNCADCAVTNSYISDIHGVGYDTQAIAGWNGSLNVTITNNYLEAAGENVMFGGADSATAELMPANITIKRNHLFKPLSWKVGDASYAGKHWTVKNLLELKAARNVTIDGNVMENNWTDGQAGVPVVFTVRNQECSAPWSTIQSVTYTNNTLRNAEGGVNFLGKDNEAEAAYGKCINPATQGSVRGTGITVINNLFTDIRGPLITLNGFYNVTIANNTSQQSRNLMTLTGEQSTGFQFNKHLTTDHDYGIFGDGGTVGTAALTKYTPGFVMTGCVIATPYGTYPPGNQYPTAPVALPPDWRSPYPGVGCDMDALNAAQGGGAVPTPTATSTPTSSPSPTATATSTPTPAPTATVTPVPSPTVAPTTQPTPNPPVVICQPNQHQSTGCRCLTQWIGNPKRCKP